VLPRANVWIDTVHSNLHLVAAFIVANPYDTVTGLPAGVENSDHIPAPEVGIDSRYQSSTEADVAGAGFLLEAFALGIDSPNEEPEIHWNARFTSTIDSADICHESGYVSA
jgi:hypothetical protein